MRTMYRPRLGEKLLTNHLHLQPLAMGVDLDAVRFGGGGFGR